VKRPPPIVPDKGAQPVVVGDLIKTRGNCDSWWWAGKVGVVIAAKNVNYVRVALFTDPPSGVSMHTSQLDVLSKQRGSP